MVLPKEKRIFVRLGFTDMGNQINGLCALIQDIRPEGPFDGSYYVFCGKMFSIMQNPRNSPHRVPGKRHEGFPAFTIPFSISCFHYQTPYSEPFFFILRL
jgi:hypothetical protein